MNQNGFRIDTYTSDSMSGTITLDEEGLILFSIPYDEGWKITLDGEEMDSVSVADGLLAVEASSGAHEIVLYYVSPGFYQGLLMTVLGLIVYLLYRRRIVNRQKKKKRIPSMEIPFQENDVNDCEIGKKF